MKNKMFATIAGAMAALCPWVTHAETFPSDGTMLENKIYESAATFSNLGTYDGTVTAVAEYADALYQVGAGQYLPAGSEGVGAVCSAGNYCPGLTDAKYSATSNQGLNACPNGYPMSKSGASVNTQCYTPCTDASVIPHATAVAGNDYYGNGTDTCYPTACDDGYHIVSGGGAGSPLIPVDVAQAGNDFAAIQFDGYVGGDAALGAELSENGTWLTSFDYGNVYGRTSCQSSDGEAMAYVYDKLYSTSANTETVRSELSAIAGGVQQMRWQMHMRNIKRAPRRKKNSLRLPMLI